MTEADEAKEAVRRIARTPALLEEARQVAPALEARAKPMGGDAVIAELVKLKLAYFIEDMTEGEWEAYWRIYRDALHVLPADALAEAIVLYNRQGLSRFPKPGELFKLAEPSAIRVRMAAWRARKAAELQEVRSHQLTPEQRAAERQAAIAAGLLTPDGKVILPVKTVPTDEAI